MIKTKSNIVRVILLLILTLNFTLSSNAMWIKVDNDSCSMDDAKCQCCCSMESSADEVGPDSHMIDNCENENSEVDKGISVCNCNLGPDTDTDFILSVVKLDHKQNVYSQSIIFFDIQNDTTHGHLVDYSILDVRINPPPIYLSISSFLI